MCMSLPLLLTPHSNGCCVQVVDVPLNRMLLRTGNARVAIIKFITRLPSLPEARKHQIEVTSISCELQRRPGWTRQSCGDRVMKSSWRQLHCC